MALAKWVPLAMDCGGEALGVGVSESWTFQDDGVVVAPDGVVDALRLRVERGLLESWLVGSTGRMLAFVTNRERAMVMLLEGEGDPGEHAVDPGADGFGDGFVLANGQWDEYPDEDTVPLAAALRIVRHILAHGEPPQDAPWQVDR